MARDWQTICLVTQREHGTCTQLWSATFLGGRQQHGTLRRRRRRCRHVLSQTQTHLFVTFGLCLCTVDAGNGHSLGGRVHYGLWCSCIRVDVYVLLQGLGRVSTGHARSGEAAKRTTVRTGALAASSVSGCEGHAVDGVHCWGKGCSSDPDRGKRSI